MDVEDGENEVSVSSFLLNSIYSRQAEVLSPEDLAWADSCLIEDSSFSETDWVPLKDALLEVISSQPQPFSTDREDIEILQEKIESVNLGLNQESSTHDSSEASSTYNFNPISVAVQMSDDENPEPSLTFMGNPFLPTYNEDLKENDTIDVGLDLDSSTYELEHASESIFKIWDLNIPTEEDDLVKQLDKVLSENSFESVSSSFDDSGKWKELKEVSVDDLIAGIADLSLKRKV
ncbi:hypothetical protein TanjilG_15219 [Lupinus angustifolius]|uniref:Uncharacterized protein n=1 Tax=Lupinus angustifolius TaxID=3871 RepID=A0A1J7HPA0_LUPAN|nr:PREDICTED: uncharacterized protein LOC109352180 [Lupinus angustifolius]XP_019449587.1 PREDICTED: uncharacterized protein LOC109352180 [Lupinus angustifolius]OIW08258.1 hypothetical protein TanjilG_15219 [Lupinus angustifolius]